MVNKIHHLSFVTATGFKPVTRDRIQTCNRLIRSQLLYSVELRGHSYIIH